MKPIYLIDNSNFCYKFKSVHKYAHVNVSGVSVDTSVLVGYIKSLKQNVFNDIAIVLDGIPMNSLSLLPSYKGTRNKQIMDSVGIPKLEVIKFLTKVGTLINKNVQVVCSPGQEADQVIASICSLVTQRNSKFKLDLLNSNRKSLKEDGCLRYLDTSKTVVSDMDYSHYDCVVVGTTDSDMYQLVSDKVKIDSSTSGKSVTMSLDTPEAVHHLPPHAIPLYKTIFGDVSDNVPALSVDINKSKVLDYLSKASASDVMSLVNNVLTCTDTANAFVKKLISVRDEFVRNWFVVKLFLESTPFRIEFNDYDVNKTIKKYNLKV